MTCFAKNSETVHRTEFRVIYVLVFCSISCVTFGNQFQLSDRDSLRKLWVTLFTDDEKVLLGKDLDWCRKNVQDGFSQVSPKTGLKEKVT